MAKHITDIPTVAFGTVAHKHFSGFEEDTAAGIIILDDGIYQKRITLFGAVSVKCILTCHFIDCFVHGLDDGRG